MAKAKREVIYRPDCNMRRPDHPSYLHANGFYIVTHGHDVVYAYFGSYYNVGEVIADVIASNEHDRTSLTGEWASMDFVVWHDSRIMAAIHQDVEDEGGAFRVQRFNEGWNIPGDYFEPFYGWPTHDEWVDSGRPDPIVLTPEDMERNRAREEGR